MPGQQKGRKGCGQAGEGQAVLHCCCSLRAAISSSPHPCSWGELCVGELGAVVYGSSSMRHQKCLYRTVLATLPAESEVLDNRPLATAPDAAALASAFSHARLLGQASTQSTPISGSGSRVACGVRGLADLAPTQRHSHRAQASSNRLAEQRLGCLSRPAFSQRAPLLNSFLLAARYTWLSSAHSPFSPSHHTPLLAYHCLHPLPAGRRSTHRRRHRRLWLSPIEATAVVST